MAVKCETRVKLALCFCIDVVNLFNKVSDVSFEKIRRKASRMETQYVFLSLIACELYPGHKRFQYLRQGDLDTTFNDLVQ